ncbi:MAG: hypothetical protein LBB21_02660, partial [Holosporaceae bacterium]|nr:hypothetical protein [Holosporaceae bacterium]
MKKNFKKPSLAVLLLSIMGIPFYADAEIGIEKYCKIVGQLSENFDLALGYPLLSSNIIYGQRFYGGINYYLGINDLTCSIMDKSSD